mgnify:CR=1 FL=1
MSIMEEEIVLGGQFDFHVLKAIWVSLKYSKMIKIVFVELLTSCKILTLMASKVPTS